MKIKILLFLTLLLTVTSPARSDLDNGWTAYSSGNYKKAFNEWLPIAEKGNAAAQYNLAGLYVNGYGTDLNEKTAFDWYRRAAQQGHPKAQYNLGVMYIIESGTNQSFFEAKHWLGLAYENGVDEAKIVWDQYELWQY